MRWRWVLLSVVAVALIGTAYFVGRETGSSDGTKTTTPVSAPSTSSGFAQLPTVKCKTLLGIQRPSTPLEAITPVALPSSLAEGLAAYRDTAGTTLIAPRGFDCQAGIGVDGGEHVTAFPKGERNPAEYPQKSGTVVTLEIARACQGCIGEAICTLFPKAKPVSFYYGGIEGQKCPEKPLREKDSYPAKSTVIFTDPPDVEGTGVGSGGVDPSLGAMSYLRPIGVRKVSCTLPEERADTCAAIVGATLAGVPLGF